MTLNVYLIMMPFPPIVILNRGKNALWERRGNEYVTWSEESMTLMESYRFIFTDFFLTHSPIPLPRPQIFRTAQDDA